VSGEGNAKTWAAVALLALTIVSATVLTALGQMTKTELLPILGGTVVVAHRLLDAMVQARKGTTQTTLKQEATTEQKAKSFPPSSTGVPVLIGMLGGGLAAIASTHVW